MTPEDEAKYRKRCQHRGISKDVADDFIKDMEEQMKDGTDVTDAYDNLAWAIAKADGNGGIRCSGLKFRGTESSWFDNNKMEMKHTESLKLLKRESCKCEECAYILIDLGEAGGDMLSCSDWSWIEGKTSKIENKATYRLVPTFSSDGLEEFHLEKESKS